MGDLDPTETLEWIDALSAVQQHRGTERAGYLLFIQGHSSPGIAALQQPQRDFEIKYDG